MVALPWSELPIDDVTVTETYTYQGKTGAVSSRNTLVQGLALAVGGTDQSFDVDYIYDDLGNVSKLTYPTCTNPNCSNTVLPGRNVDYLYNQGLLAEVVGWTSTTPVDYWETGAFEKITHSNGVSDNQVLDASVKSRPKKLHTTNVVNNEGWGSGEMSYDGAGNITQMVRTGMTNTFVYDEASRLVEASVENWLETYEYDAFGNITRIETTEPGVGTLPPYEPDIDELTNRIEESVGVDYDDAGNLTLSSLSYSYEWNPLNQLERQVNPSNRRWFHIYTAEGERLVTIDWWEGVPSRQATFTLRGLGSQVLSQFELVGPDQSGNWERDRDYIYAGSRLLASDDESGSGEVHYHLDHLGTPRLLTDATGARISAHDYLPYGEEITVAGADVMKFTGHERDIETGHDYMHARYYHEYLGRFLSVDLRMGMISKPQTLNRYMYASGSPMRFVDPTGLSITLPTTGFAYEIRRGFKNLMKNPKGFAIVRLFATLPSDVASVDIYAGIPISPSGEIGAGGFDDENWDIIINGGDNDSVATMTETLMHEFIHALDKYLGLGLTETQTEKLALLWLSDDPLKGMTDKKIEELMKALGISENSGDRDRDKAVAKLRKRITKMAREASFSDLRKANNALANALFNGMFNYVMSFHEDINPLLYPSGGGNCSLRGVSCVPWAF